MIDTQFC